MLDLLIQGGQIINGTGNAGFPGAVGVEGDTLRIFRGDVSKVPADRWVHPRNDQVIGHKIAILIPTFLFTL